MVDFKEIKDFPGYSITADGRVWSQKRKKYLSPFITNNGYKRVVLSHKNVKTKHLIHRLVANAFLSNPDNLEQVNHLDGNKLNNSVSNLEWCTPKYNTNHAVKLGLRDSVGASNKNASLDDKDVLTIKKLLAEGKTQTLVAKMFSVGQAAISKIATGRTWSHV